MSQTALIPIQQGEFSLAQTPKGTVDSHSQSVVSLEETPVPFGQTLEESMQALDDEVYSEFAWFAAFQAGESTMPHNLINGRLLPFNEGLDGKNLPPLGAASQLNVQSLLFQNGFTRPDLPAEAQLELNLQQVLPKTQYEFISTAVGTTGTLSGVVDLPGVGDAPIQLNGMPQQSIHGSPTVRTGMLLPPVSVPVGQAGWDQAMGERIQWMVGRNIQEAEVKLTPPHLGPLEIKISVQNDQTNISFLAAQAPTREALEAAIPRLKEMLGDANLNLVSVDVGQRESSGSGQSQTNGSEDRDSGASSSEVMSERITATSGRQVGKGLVDDYA